MVLVVVGEVEEHILVLEEVEVEYILALVVVVEECTLVLLVEGEVEEHILALEEEEVGVEYILALVEVSISWEQVVEVEAVAHIPQVLEDHILSADHNHLVDDGMAQQDHLVDGMAQQDHSLLLVHLNLQDSHIPQIQVQVLRELEEEEGVEHALEQQEYEQISSIDVCTFSLGEEVEVV